MKPGKIVAESGATKRVHAKTLAPDSLAYKNLNPEQVPSDERFIHRYAYKLVILMPSFRHLTYQFPPNK